MTTKIEFPLVLYDEDGNCFHLSEKGTQLIESEQNKSTHLSNFCLIVADFFIFRGETDNGSSPLFRLSLTRETETSLLPETFSMQALRKWLNELPDPRLTVFSQRKNVQRIIDSVRLQLSGEPRKIFSVTHSGWNCLGDHWVYVLGEKLYLPPKLNPHDIQWNGVEKLHTYEKHTAADNIDEKLESAAWFLLLARSIPSVTSPLCLYLLLCLTYTRLVTTDIFPQFWMWVVGHSGSGKTSVCEQTLCFLPNNGRKALTVSLTGTSAGINQALAECYDLPLILDDFSSSEGTQQQRMYRDLIDMIMRQSTNGSGRRTQSGYQKAHCLAIVTAERPLENYSLASRALSIFVPSVMNFSLFDQLQLDSHLLTSFIDHFLSWLVENPDVFQILELNKDWLLTPQCNRPFDDARLTSHTRFLYAALGLLVTYLSDIGLPEPYINTASKFFSVEIQKLGANNMAFLRQLKQNGISGKTTNWILQLSQALLSKREFTIGKDASSLTDPSVDACWHKGNIAVKPQAILRFLRQTFPEGAWDTQTVYQALAAAKLVKPGKDGKTTRVIGRCGRMLVFKTENLRLHAAASW